MNNKKVKCIIYWIPAAVVLGLIWYFSSMPAVQSDEQSGLFMNILANTFGFVGVELDHRMRIWEVLHVVIRKCAHMTEYAVLAMCFYLGFFGIKQAGYNMTCMYRVSLICTMVAAAIDEIHQLFVPGRAGMIADVGIDTIGAVIGLLIIYFLLGK